MTIKSRSRIGLLLALALAIGALTVLPASAGAQGASSDPTAAVYGDDDGETASFESGGSSGGGAASDDPSGLYGSIGSLPFSGMDLIVLAGVALVLTGTGLALRRASMPRGPQV